MSGIDRRNATSGDAGDVGFLILARCGTAANQIDRRYRRNKIINRAMFAWDKHMRSV